MANEMRDRLVEMLKTPNKSAILRKVNPQFVTEETSEESIIADFLIENGVIVPPCKVGDTVYVLEPCSCFNGYRTFEECHHRRTKATKWVDVVMVKNRHHNRCMKLFERPYKPEYIFKIGETVFLTKSEAEQKLKEMRGE
jgi:hypothetical protein